MGVVPTDYNNTRRHMYLQDEALQEMTENVRQIVEELQQENDPEDADYLADMQDIYSCLQEVQAWRQRFPGVRMEPIFLTNYGVQRLQ